MPNTNTNTNEQIPIIKFETEKVTAAPSRTERRMFSNFKQNGRSGLYVNIKSKTPDNEKTLINAFNKNYINIEFNDELRAFFASIHDNFEPEHLDRLDNDYNFEDFINSCEYKGLIKCEAKPSDFVKPGFFSHIVKRRGKPTVEPLTGPDFIFDRIKKAVYILNVSGCWRSQKMHGGDYRTEASGLKINVLGVLIKSYITEEEEQTINEEKRRNEQIAQAVEQLNESDEDETTD